MAKKKEEVGPEKSEVVVSIDMAVVDQQIADHEAQFKQLSDNFQQLETEFNQKKDWARMTAEQLRGAIIALKGLKESVSRVAKTE